MILDAALKQLDDRQLVDCKMPNSAEHLESMEYLPIFLHASYVWIPCSSGGWIAQGGALYARDIGDEAWGGRNAIHISNNVEYALYGSLWRTFEHE